MKCRLSAVYLHKCIFCQPTVYKWGQTNDVGQNSSAPLQQVVTAPQMTTSVMVSHRIYFIRLCDAFSSKCSVSAICLHVQVSVILILSEMEGLLASQGTSWSLFCLDKGIGTRLARATFWPGRKGRQHKPPPSQTIYSDMTPTVC